MNEVWNRYRTTFKGIYKEEYDTRIRHGQRKMARTMIMIAPNDALDIIAEMTSLSIKEAEIEKDRLNDAWELVLRGHPDVEVLKTGIDIEELQELKIIRKDRWKLFYAAFKAGMTHDMLKAYFDLTDVESDFWLKEYLTIHKTNDGAEMCSM